MIDRNLIEWLRAVRFEPRMRGYDREQVDRFLADLLDRLEAELVPGDAPPPGSELLGVGEKVEEILRAAAETAETATRAASEKAISLREEAEEEADRERSSASTHAERTRREADEYAERTRDDADREAGRLLAEAEKERRERVTEAKEEAARIQREGELEREQIEESLQELRERRRMIVLNLERLRGSLGTMVGEAEQGTTEWAALGGERPGGLLPEEAGPEADRREEEPAILLGDDTAAAFNDDDDPFDTDPRLEQPLEEEGSGDDRTQVLEAEPDEDEDEDDLSRSPGGEAAVFDTEEEELLAADTEAWSIEELDEPDGDEGDGEDEDAVRGEDGSGGSGRPA
jgi:DivIVA domain-containing protein